MVAVIRYITPVKVEKVRCCMSLGRVIQTLNNVFDKVEYLMIKPQSLTFLHC